MAFTNFGLASVSLPSTTFPRRLKIILACLSIWTPLLTHPPHYKVFSSKWESPLLNHSNRSHKNNDNFFFTFFFKVSRKTLPPISFSKIILITLFGKISPSKFQHNSYKEYSICIFFGGHFSFLYVMVTVAHVSDVFRTLSNI